jgi:hypothetical protein
LKIPALPVHTDDDVAEVAPGVERPMQQPQLGGTRHELSEAEGGAEADAPGNRSFPAARWRPIWWVKERTRDEDVSARVNVPP